MTALTAAVAGASGYTGGELLRLLADHPDIEVSVLTAGSHAGELVTDLHPHLLSYAGRTLSATTADELAAADIIFLALPHGHSGSLAAELPPGACIVDLGADHRLESAQKWQSYYGPGHAGTWTYGLPELPGAREAIASSQRVANPGCFPTGVILGMTPLLAADLVEPEVVVVAASGTSGAGRTARTDLLATEVMGSMTAYKVGGVHQHTPEMEQALSKATHEAVTVSFTPMLAPMPRGILATSSAPLAKGATAEAVREALHSAYAHEPFVHLLSEGRWPTTAAVAGSNHVHMQVAVDEHAGRVVVVTAIDNLTKGAAGQAVQNANLMLGLPEDRGLTKLGVAP